MASHDPEIRAAAAKVAANARVAQTPYHQLATQMEKARAVQYEMDRFAVDPTGELAEADPDELERRVTARRRERLARAGLASARARRERQAAAEAAKVAAELDALAALEDGAA